MAQYRKDVLTSGQCYHVFNKSIAGFTIMNNPVEYERMLSVLKYYQHNAPPVSFSRFLELSDETIKNEVYSSLSSRDKLIQIVAYCLMPTHLHFILKQFGDNGISAFMSNVLNSYARYFNLRHNRKGPLWQGRFKSVFVEKDEQLMHLTRYIHLNPVTACLVSKAEEWKYSSYAEYVSADSVPEKVCKYDDILNISSSSYKKFVNDSVSYHRESYIIKNIIIE